MSTVNKKMIFVIGSIFMMLSLFTPKITVEAGTLLTLQQLQQKFPHGKYWNHAGSGRNNPDGYTNTGCYHHGNCSKGGTDYSGWCGCNSFGSSIQCFGFANKCAYDVYGSYYTSWSRGSLNTVKPGDVIRYKNNTHSIFVTGVNGNVITYGDCNSDGHCQIMWNKTISKATIQSTLTAVYSAPWQLSSVSAPHTHSYTKYVFYEAIHPHYKCYQCTICGDVERRTTEPVYLKDCNYCKNHTHSYTQKTFYEAIHPHYQCYKCVYCDAVERRTTEPVYLKDCTYCKNHTHSYTQKTFYEKCHPHYQCYKCTTCDAVERKLSEPLYFDDCGYCNYSKFGDGFYAYIVQKDTGVPVINYNGNVEVGSTVGDKNSIWKFVRQSDGSYAIYSCVDGKAMNVENGDSGQSFSNINTIAYDGTKKQLWSIIWKTDDSFSLRSKCNTGTILNIKDNKSVKGTNICTASYDNSNAQTFSIVRLSDLLQIKAPTVSVRAGSSLAATSISWTSVNNAEAYDLMITDTTGKIVEEKMNLSGTSVSQNLPAGTYQVKISAKNTRYETLLAESEAKSFTVAQESGEWSGSVVFNKNTYELYDYSLNWEEANTFCEKMGGHLVTITSEEEQNEINRLIKKGKYVRYWQGLTDKEVEGEFVYVTGETTTYSNWCAGEPNNKGNEDYVAIMKPSGEWVDYAVTGVNMEVGRTGFILEREYVPVTSLKTDEQLTLAKGKRQVLKTIVTPKNATNTKFTYKNSNPSVVSVSNDGEITAVNSGVAVVTIVSEDGVQTSCCVTVYDISNESNELEIEVQDEAKLTYTVSPQNAVDLPKIVWSSSNKEVVSVDTEGKITALKVGEAEVTATMGEAYIKWNVCVKNALQGIGFNTSLLQLKNGESKNLSIQYYPEKAMVTTTPIWVSMNEKVASVDEDNRVIAKGYGETDILAIVDGFRAICHVIVGDDASSITVLPEESDSIILNENDKFQVQLKVYPENAVVPSVSFDIEDTQVAQVNENGEIIALNAGSTVLKVRTDDGRYTWQKKIIVNNGQTDKYISLQDADIEVMDKVVYTGSERKPKVMVKVNEQPLAEGKDYTLSYQNNVMAGKGQVIVKGIGNYIGTAQKEFVIAKAAAEYRGDTEFVMKQGDTLESIELPLGLYIEESNQIMDKPGNFTCYASYNPDFDNYETQTGVSLLIHVQEGKENAQEQFLEEGDELLYKNGIYEVVEADEDGSAIQLLEWDQSNETNIILPDSIVYNGVVYYVVEIGEKAFKNNKKITSITIGKHVTEIGRQAFSGCKGLVTIKGGDSVETIGEEAFYNCTKLTSTIHFKKLKSLGNRCFKGCKRITRVYLGKAVKRIGKEAFCNCKQLKQITVATTKLESKSVGKNAFTRCSSKMKVRVPSKRYRKYKKIFIKRGISDESKFLK